MKIFVPDIKEKPLVLAANEPIENLPGLLAMESEGEAHFADAVRTQVSVVREHDLIRVQGNVTTTVRLTCSRCLAEYDMELVSPFTLFFTRGGGNAAEEETELSEEDLISASYDGDEIDLLPYIEEQVIMTLPLKPLCKEECLGLCSNCGSDLNNASCSCDRTSTNLKFGALKNLKIEK